MPFASTLIASGLHTTQITPGSVAVNLTAAGATQATALVLRDEVNIIGTAAASTGVLLPQTGVGDDIVVVNGGANAVLVYPPVGHQINSLAANAGYSLAVAKAARCLRVSETRWVVIAA
ncbi:MAG: hypothetical protein ACK54C_02055 [Betaproteobacteria bacterium]